MLTLIALFTAAAGVQLVCWIVVGIGSRRCLGRRNWPDMALRRPISVVVAVHNGAESLPRLFDALKDQTTGSDEIIVIDDHSIDGTAGVVDVAMAEYPIIRLISSRGTGKKSALTEGIAAAANETLALTDADCIPGPDWLAEIRRIHEEVDECIVVGYGPYLGRADFLSSLIRYETLHTAVLFIAALAFGRPYMAVGRNLSYTKRTFRRIGGFDESLDLLSGDDDLFVQSAAARGVRVRFMSRPSAFSYSEAPSNVAAWLKQKRRHLSASRRYRLLPKLSLFVYHASALLCWLAPLAVGWMGVACLLCRLIPGQIVLSYAGSALRERNLAAWFVPLDLTYQIYLIVVAPIAWFRPPREW